MEEKVLLQKGNNLQLKFDITHEATKNILTFTSKKYVCGAVNFQLNAVSTRCFGKNDDYAEINTIISIRFIKLFKDDDLTYTCKFASEHLENVNLKITENNTWHQVYVHKQVFGNNTSNGILSFDATFSSNLSAAVSPFAPLHEDTDSTDFKLCGEEGSVEVHKLVLKASSPVLQGMLNGEWKETTEGKITIADASKETLENFKDYIYLDKLPNNGVEQLLLLGSFFMMPDLVQKCVVKLLNTLNDDNFIELVEFSAKFKVTNLCLTLLRFVKSGLIDIDHFCEDNLADMCQATNSILTFKK